MVVSGIYNAQSFISLKLLLLDKYPMLNVERKFRWAFWCSEILRIFWRNASMTLVRPLLSKLYVFKNNRLQDIQQPPLKTRHQREPQDNFAKMETIKWNILVFFFLVFGFFETSILCLGMTVIYLRDHFYLCLPRLWSEGVCHCARFSGIDWAPLFQ